MTKAALIAMSAANNGFIVLMKNAGVLQGITEF
jgi:hypothetical protein